MWGKPKNRRKSEERRWQISGAWLARLGIAAAVLVVLGIAVTLTLGTFDQNITQVSVTGRFQRDRKSTRLNSSHPSKSRMPSSA